MLKNGVVTSAEGFTININGLGAKGAYNNMTASTRETTIFNINYTMLFVYDSTRVSGGGWICYRGYDANTNTIGYQLRTNSSTMPVSDATYRYRLLFTQADGQKWVPANTSSSTDATVSKTVNQRPIDPFGEIVYYSSTTELSAGDAPGPATQWQQYQVNLGYSFNRTGSALTLTPDRPVYVKCAPQTDGSAIIDSSVPFVQALPTSADGKIYIFLGTAYSATSIELKMNHPVYWHDGTGIKEWTGGVPVTDAVNSLDEQTGDLYLGYTTIGSASLASNVTVLSGVQFDGGSFPYASGKTVVTGGSTTSITPVTKKTVVTSASGATASYANGILTITNGSFGTGDSVTAGTAISVYTSLSTGNSIDWYDGTSPSLSYTSTVIPTVAVTQEQVVVGVTSDPTSENVGRGLVGQASVG